MYFRIFAGEKTTVKIRVVQNLSKIVYYATTCNRWMRQNTFKLFLQSHLKNCSILSYVRCRTLNGERMDWLASRCGSIVD